MKLNTVALTALTLSSLMLSSAVMAANEIATARVQIVPAINITEQTEIDFGTLSNIDGTCTMSSGGSLSGTAGMECAGDEVPGQFNISGLDGAVISLSVTQGFSQGVTFQPVIDGSNSRTLEGGVTTVVILGSLTLNNAQDGEQNISYTLTANYE